MINHISFVKKVIVVSTVFLSVVTEAMDYVAFGDPSTLMTREHRKIITTTLQERIAKVKKTGKKEKIYAFEHFLALPLEEKKHSPLYFATKYLPERHDIIEDLLKMGADPSYQEWVPLETSWRYIRNASMMQLFFKYEDTLRLRDIRNVREHREEQFGNLLMQKFYPFMNKEEKMKCLQWFLHGYIDPNYPIEYRAGEGIWIRKTLPISLLLESYKYHDITQELQLLIAYGADPAKQYEGKSAYDITEEHEWEGHATIMQEARQQYKDAQPQRITSFLLFLAATRKNKTSHFYGLPIDIAKIIRSYVVRDIQ